MVERVTTKAAERAVIQATFKTVLDQYNRNLGIAIETSKKCIGVLLTVAAIYYGLHRECTSAPAPRVIITFVVISAVLVAFFIWMQIKYFERCRYSIDFLTAHAAVAHPPGLPALGILPDEHCRIIPMWSAAFILLVIAVLGLIVMGCR